MVVMPRSEALPQFTAWADSRGIHNAATFIRADPEAYPLFLQHSRSPHLHDSEITEAMYRQAFVNP
jgi:hypothetical protein